MDPGLPQSFDDIVYGKLSNRSAFVLVGYHPSSAYFQMFAIRTLFQRFQKGKVLRLRFIRDIQARRGHGQKKIIRREGLQNSEVECGDGFQVSIYDFKLRSVGIGEYVGHLVQSWVVLVSGRTNPCRPCPLYLHLMAMF
jgi:hypothetical protein